MYATKRLGFMVVAVVTSIAVGTACGTAERGSAGGIHTVFDSTSGDTIVARVAGAVANADVRHLTPDLRIAPAEDDTTLFTRINEVDVDGQGRMWVFDAPSASIFVFRPDGSLERRVGRQGAGPGEFRNDNGMVFLPDGRLALWDGQNARVAFIHPDGTFEKSWPHASGFFTSNGLDADTAGNVYVKRPVAEPTAEDSFWRMGLVRLGDGGAWADSLVPPALGVHVETYVAANKGGRSSSSVSYGPSALWAWHRDGYFVAVNGATYRVYIGRPGRPIRIERDLPPVPVTADERKNEEEFILSSMRSTDSGWTWTGAAVPDHKAPARSVAVARDGRIWVGVAAPSELIPEADRAESKGGRPVRRWRANAVYEVFTPEGAFVMRVALPPSTTFVDADGNTVWGIQRDALGLEAVVRFTAAK